MNWWLNSTKCIFCFRDWDWPTNEKSILRVAFVNFKIASAEYVLIPIREAMRAAVEETELNQSRTL